MRRCFTLALACLFTVAWAAPAFATMADKVQTDSKGVQACGNANGFNLWSWIKADIGGAPTDEVRYDANPNSATYKDLRILVDNPTELESIKVTIRKQQADGSGWTDHYSVRRFGPVGWADNQELFEFDAVTNIQKDRHPYLHVEFDWNDGACGSKTAWLMSWIP